jgi:ABC transporter DrrB family efflux protein
MSARATLATAERVLHQLRRDPRTLALLIFVPVLLLALLKWEFSANPATFQRIGVPLLGVFPLISLFIVTSITMLRERTTGTLERLMTLPIAKLDLLAGYALAFTVIAVAQAVAATAVAFGLLDLHADAPVAAVIAIAALNAAHGMAFGLFLSAFARTEFQAVQFLPAFLLPQLLLSGLLAPRAAMPDALQAVANVLPMTYAFDALARLAQGTGASGDGLVLDVVVVAATTVGALLLGAATLRRRTE